MERCIELYNQLLNEVTKNSSCEQSINLLNQDDNTKYNSIKTFYNSLADNNMFLLFSKMKIKVFSAKTVETHSVSTSLFSEDLTLKSIFNNMSDPIKNVYWEKLFRLYIEVSKNDNINQDITKDRIMILITAIKTIKNSGENMVKNDLFKVDVNNTTNDMIGDIVGSFQNIISNKSNPFDNIMNITNMISGKYKDQLENGDIQLDKILGGIEGIIPGLMKQGEQAKKETVIIDENFSTSDVNLGNMDEKKDNNMMNMMKMIPNMSNLVNMVSRINTAETNEDLTSIKKDMDNYLEKELKVDMSQFNELEKNIKNQMEPIDPIDPTDSVD